MPTLMFFVAVQVALPRPVAVVGFWPSQAPVVWQVFASMRVLPLDCEPRLALAVVVDVVPRQVARVDCVPTVVPVDVGPRRVAVVVYVPSWEQDNSGYLLVMTDAPIVDDRNQMPAQYLAATMMS